MAKKPTRIPGVTVRQRKSGWQAQVRVGKDRKTGRWLFRSVTCDSEAEAWEAGRKLLEERDEQRAQHVQPTQQTLSTYLDEWLARKTADGLKPKTLYDYTRICQMIGPHLGSVRLRDLSPSKVQAWQDSLAATAATKGAAQAALAYRVLRSALSDAERLGLVPTNVARRARPAMRTTPKREGFTLQEAQAVLREAKTPRSAALFGFMLHSGLRIGEALGLRWGDVDLTAGILTVRNNRVHVGSRMIEGAPKNKRGTRTFVLLAAAVEGLQQRAADQAGERAVAGAAWTETGLVFTTRSGGPLDTTRVERTFRSMRQRAEVRPLPPHSLRHATASILLGAGVPVAVAAKMLGHSVAMFCETYADLLVEASRDAARQADEWLARQRFNPSGVADEERRTARREGPAVAQSRPADRNRRPS